MTPLVTLTSDFGTRDPYAAQMKGVIYAQCPDARVVDLTHDIAVRDVMEAALFVSAAIPRFPPGTCHVVVIDPGVGGERFPIAANFEGRYVFCPNNGVVTMLKNKLTCESVHVIANPSFILKSVSATFHGRDVFAPAAAAVAGGAKFTDIGPPLERPTTLDLAKPQHNSNDTLTGCVIHVDRFGNLITNIDREMLSDFGFTRIRLGPVEVNKLARTYNDVPEGSPAVLIGSTGYLEIAVNRRSAHTELGLGRGSAITIE